MDESLKSNFHKAIQNADRFAGSPEGLLKKTEEVMQEKGFDFPDCLKKR